MPSVGEGPTGAGLLRAKSIHAPTPMRGLVTYYTAFVIELHSRRVHVLGTTPYPDEAFVMQTFRPLTGGGAGTLGVGRILICDRDPKWSPGVQQFLAIGWRAHGPDAGACPQLQRPRGAMCATQRTNRARCHRSTVAG
jgi:hypothetical protein